MRVHLSVLTASDINMNVGVCKHFGNGLRDAVGSGGCCCGARGSERAGKRAPIEWTKAGRALKESLNVHHRNQAHPPFGQELRQTRRERATGPNTRVCRSGEAANNIDHRPRPRARDLDKRHFR